MRTKAIREYRQSDILFKKTHMQINPLFTPFIWTLRAAPLVLMHLDGMPFWETRSGVSRVTRKAGNWPFKNEFISSDW